MTQIEHYLAPRDLAEAVQAMQDGDVTVLCGGTDLTPQLDSGKRRLTRTLMNIRRIRDLSGVQCVDGALRIGALATVTQIMEDPLVRSHAPVLVQTADQFASAQIRNAASIGGNLCNASPAGDMIIPLLVLGAEVELASWHDDGVSLRRVPLCDFFTGPGATVKQADELLTAVIFDLPPETFRAAFLKTGPRPALEISLVSVGIGGILEAGCLKSPRAALGAVAPTPIRARSFERWLEGRQLDEATLHEAGIQMLKEAAPIDDVRGSAWYRNHLIQVFTGDVLTHVAQG